MLEKGLQKPATRDGSQDWEMESWSMKVRPRQTVMLKEVEGEEERERGREGEMTAEAGRSGTRAYR